MFMNTYISEIVANWRNCLRNPGFLSLSGLTLALGVGTCVTTFALIDDFVLNPPPYSDPARLALLGPVESSPLTTMSPLQYQQLAGLPDYDRFGAASVIKFWNVAGDGQPVLVPGRPVDRGFLTVLGVTMSHGRNFAEEEDRSNGPSVVIVSHRLWVNQFGGSPNIVGKGINLDGKPATVVGVLPASFSFGEPLDVLVPLALPEHSNDDGNHLMVIGRLGSGVTFDQASTDLNARLYSRAADIRLKPSDHVVFSATSLWHDLSGRARSVVFLFFGFSGCLLALVAANLSNLFLLRSLIKSHDIAVRSALGASTFRLGLPSLAEGFLIGVVGVIGGLGLARSGLLWIRTYIPLDWMNSVQGAYLGPHAYVFAIMLGAAVATLSSALAIRRSRKRSVVGELVAGCRSGLGRSVRRTERALLIAQVSFASALLVIAMTFSRSLWRLSAVDLGLKPDSILTFTVNPLPARYPDAAAMQMFTRNLIERLRRISAAEEVTASTNPPIGPPFSIPIELPDGETKYLQYRPVTRGYFYVFGIPRIAGRDFTELDGAKNETVAIVNATFAQRYFNGQALGRSIKLGLRPSNSLRIVGVVGDVRQSGPQFPVEALVYVPLAQVSDSLLQDMREFLAMHFYLRLKGNSVSAAPSVNAAMQEVAPDQAITELTSFGDVVARSTASQRLDFKLVGILSLLALVIANVGLYSVASVSIANQKRDLGVQAALGAMPRILVGHILRQVLRQLLSGLAIGVLLGLLASRFLRNVIAGFDGTRLDDVSLTGLLLILVGLLVCVGPAVRAARINPIAALREQ